MSNPALLSFIEFYDCEYGHKQSKKKPYIPETGYLLTATLTDNRFTSTVRVLVQETQLREAPYIQLVSVATTRVCSRSFPHLT